MSKNKLIKFKDPVFRAEFTFSVGMNFKSARSHLKTWAKKFKKFNIDDFDSAFSNNLGFVVNNESENLFFIFLRNRKPELIAHEINHVVNTRLGALNINPYADSGEPHAYYTDFITEQFYRRLRK